MKTRTKLITMLMALAFLITAVMPVHAETTKTDTPTNTSQGMFALYEKNRAEGIPNYITEDFILLAYCMMMNETITVMEETLLSRTGSVGERTYPYTRQQGEQRRH